MKEAFKEIFKEELEEERKEGVLETLASLVKDGILSIADAAKRANMTTSEFQAKMAGMK